MRPVKFEKLVRMATFEELRASRKPDYKARNEIRTLKRNGISATYEIVDENSYRVVAYAKDVCDMKYLVLKRGFEKSEFIVEKKAVF